MYKRYTGQLSMLESPEMFGNFPLNPKNRWIRMSQMIPWDQFDEKYTENFHSKKGQCACDSRMALVRKFRLLEKNGTYAGVTKEPFSNKLNHYEMDFGLYVRRKKLRIVSL